MRQGWIPGGPMEQYFARTARPSLLWRESRELGVVLATKLTWLDRRPEERERVARVLAQARRREERRYQDLLKAEAGL